MIRPYNVIKHRDSMDVCFRVISVYKGSTEFKLKGYWYNQGYVNSWRLLDRVSHIKIKYENMKDILYAAKGTEDCYRYADWKQYVSK